MKIFRRQPMSIASKASDIRENEAGIQALTFCSEQNRLQKSWRLLHLTHNIDVPLGLTNGVHFT